MPASEPTPATLGDLVASLKALVSRIDGLAADIGRLLPSQSRVTNTTLDLANGIRQLIPKFEEAGKRHDASRVAFDDLARDLKRVVEQLTKLNMLDLTSILREINSNLALLGGGVTDIKHEVREATDPRLQLRREQEGEVERRAGAATKFLTALNKVSPRTQFVVIALALIVAVAVAAVYILKASGG